MLPEVVVTVTATFELCPVAPVMVKVHVPAATELIVKPPATVCAMVAIPEQSSVLDVKAPV
jgi:hypothetical protein